MLSIPRFTFAMAARVLAWAVACLFDMEGSAVSASAHRHTFTMDPMLIAVGRVTGTVLAVAGWVGTQVVASTVSDPVSAFESTIQWGAIAVLGILLIVVFCFYLPGKDKRQLEMQERFLKTEESLQQSNADLVREIEERFDAREARRIESQERIAAIMERQQGLCAEAHEILRRPEKERLRGDRKKADTGGEKPRTI